jgi:hypothetical protein
MDIKAYSIDLHCLDCLAHTGIPSSLDSVSPFASHDSFCGEIASIRPEFASCSFSRRPCGLWPVGSAMRFALVYLSQLNLVGEH